MMAPPHDPAAATCFALGASALDGRGVAAACLELQASGAFCRSAFVRGLQSAASTEQWRPERLVEAAAELLASGVFGPQLLQALLPDPPTAGCAIHRACASPPVACRLLQDAAGAAAAAGAPAATRRRALPAPVQLLALLMDEVLAPEDAGGAPGCAAGPLCGGGGGGEEEDGARQYAAAVLRYLEVAATQHEALAECLFRAAAACVAFADQQALAGWVCGQLRRHFAADDGAASAPAEALAVARRAWGAAALSHGCWRAAVAPCAAACLGLQELLRQLQSLVTPAAAAGDPERLARLAAVLSGLRAGGPRESRAVLQMLASALAAALREGQLERLLPPLLLAQHPFLLLEPGEYEDLLHSAASASLLPDSTAAAAGWSSLMGGITLTLPTAGPALAQAHLQLVRRLAATVAAGSPLRRQLGALADTLRDTARALGGGRQTPTLNEGFRSLLLQFGQCAPFNGRRRLTPAAAANWRMQRGHVAAFADALSLSPPEGAAEARLRWEYLMALQDINLLPLGQLEKLHETCSTCGIDLAGASAGGSAAEVEGASEGGGGAAGALQLLLDKLPGAVGKQQALAARSLLASAGQQLAKLLGEQQQQQQQQQQQGAGGGGGHPAKKQRLQRPEPHSALAGRLAAALLAAYDASLAQQAGGLSLEWRLEFVEALQAAPEPLHAAVAQHLLHTLHGAWQGSSQAVCGRGCLLALMAAHRPAQTAALQPGPDGALLAHREAAAAAFCWAAAGAASSVAGARPSGAEAACAQQQQQRQQRPAGAGAGAGGALPSPEPAVRSGRLPGADLARTLLGGTQLGSVRQRCCAAAFWAGYLAEVQRRGQWCAGPLGPFGARSSGTGGSGAVPRPQQTAAAPGAGAQPGRLLGFVPVQLVALLRDVAAHLEDDVRRRPGSGGPWELLPQGGEAGATVEAIEPQVVRETLKACQGLLSNSLPLRWLMQQFAL